MKDSKLEDTRGCVRNDKAPLSFGFPVRKNYRADNEKETTRYCKRRKEMSVLELILEALRKGFEAERTLMTYVIGYDGI